MPMRIYIMRHGETDWNRENKIQGRVDIPLNENGRELARITAEKLKKIPFAAAITSPLIRAKDYHGRPQCADYRGLAHRGTGIRTGGGNAGEGERFLCFGI